MIDINIPQEYLVEQLEKHSSTIRVEFSPDQWAPAIWAGTEGLPLVFFGQQKFIHTVDLDRRHVYLADIK